MKDSSLICIHVISSSEYGIVTARLIPNIDFTLLELGFAQANMSTTGPKYISEPPGR
jgi:hypothetical protein